MKTHAPCPFACRRTTSNLRFASCLALLGTTALIANRADADDLGQRNSGVWECEEYSLTNSTWSGNPFDVVATVTFLHADEKRVTEMFYAGRLPAPGPRPS